MRLQSEKQSELKTALTQKNMVLTISAWQKKFLLRLTRNSALIAITGMGVSLALHHVLAKWWRITSQGGLERIIWWKRTKYTGVKIVRFSAHAGQWRNMIELSMTLTSK